MNGTPAAAAALPKPVAVMADTDRRAAQVLAACLDEGLAVPADVSVLGCDNDPVFTLHTRPTLTSVAPPHREQGHRIAVELDRLMKARRQGREVEGVRLSLPSARVVARESTRPVGAQEVFARRIAEFVRENAAAGPKVADVARHFNCSRQLVETAVRADRRQTVRDFIADCRVEEAKRRLRAKGATVVQVAAECGFKTAAHLSHLFRRRTGLSIREWLRSTPGR